MWACTYACRGAICQKATEDMSQDSRKQHVAWEVMTTRGTCQIRRRSEVTSSCSGNSTTRRSTFYTSASKLNDLQHRRDSGSDVSLVAGKLRRLPNQLRCQPSSEDVTQWIRQARRRVRSLTFAVYGVKTAHEIDLGDVRKYSQNHLIRRTVSIIIDASLLGHALCRIHTGFKTPTICTPLQSISLTIVWVIPSHYQSVIVSLPNQRIWVLM